MGSSVRDVAVVGAGPVGAMTARLLAERGHDVVVLEEHREPGRPVHCTGLLGADAFDEFDLPRDTILGFTSAARFWSADGQSVLVESDRVKATVIDRVRFDQHLTGQAASAGAAIRIGHRVERLSVEPHRVLIEVENGETVEARACVLACGANYRFHHQLGLGVPQAYMRSAQVETPFPAAAHVQVRLGRETAPDGFAWLVPFTRGAESYARIGLMCNADSRRHFEAFVRTLCEEAGVDPATVPAPVLKMLPLAPVSKTFASRVLAVGDAAGLVKPTTGGGIYYGLLSGTIAADVLDAALHRDRLGESELSRYERQWRKRLGSELRMALAFRHMAERLDDKAINAVVELARVNGVVPLLRDTASFNWHRKALVSLMSHAEFRGIIIRALCA